MRRGTGGLVAAALAFGAVLVLLPRSRPLFATLFPTLERPLYEQAGFGELVLAHLALAGASSLAAAALGVAAAVFVTRPAGAEFRPMVETVAAIGQTFPPVAVLALAVPAIGFGFAPAFLALLLYGLLPVVQSTIAGIVSVPEPVREAARGIGLGEGAILARVELPLAAPTILAGIRVSTIVNIGTAAVASTAGAETLGLPIIVGLNASNVAYVIQGAVLVALLAVLVDLAFQRLADLLEAWRSA